MVEQKVSETNREQKRAQFAAPEKKSSKTPLIIVAAIVVLAAAAGFALWSSSDEKTVSGDVRIPIADLDGGKAKFFNYTLPDQKQIRFFALKSADGTYRAAIDACDTCYHAKKGYRQEGDRLICNNCGMEFPSDQINEVRGGCNPVGLPRQVEGEAVVIKAGDLAVGSKYF